MVEESKLKETLVVALKKAVTTLPADVVHALHRAKASEDSELAKAQLGAILRNVEIAREESIPICQDTGIQTFYIEAGAASPYLGQLRSVIAEVVSQATETIPLRANTVHPFTGKNPGNNLGRGMPVIHWEPVEGDQVAITLLPKGGGSDNMSALRMLSPSDGVKGIKRAVVDHIIACGGKPCPPTIVGVGIGGGADVAMALAKRALLREIGNHHSAPEVAALEEELLELINLSGVGPMGLGGWTTSLAVHVEYAFRHPASLPVGIQVQCWADRRARVRVSADGSIEVN